MNKKTGVRQQEILHHSTYCFVVNAYHDNADLIIDISNSPVQNQLIRQRMM